MTGKQITFIVLIMAVIAFIVRQVRNEIMIDEG